MNHRFPRRAAAAAVAFCGALGIAVSASTPQAARDVATRDVELSVTILPPGTEPTINVAKIAADGTVVGSAPPAGHVLRWRPGAGAPQNLGGGPMFSFLNRLPLVSADALIIVANRQIPDETGRMIGVPSMWSDDRDWSALPGLVLRRSILTGGARDLRHIVGYGWNDQPNELAQAWVWSGDRGQRTLPVVSLTYGGEAWAVSEDGEVVAGHQFDFPALPNPRRRYFATRWSGGNMRALRDATGTQLGQTYACNRDCSVIIGGGQGGDPDPSHPNAGQAWAWSEATGATYLGTTPDAAPGTTSYATDITSDGAMIVGTYYRANGDGSISYRGFLWTRETGMISLQDLLVKHGITHSTDWHSVIPTALSPSGDMILVGGQDASLEPSGYILRVRGLVGASAARGRS